MDDKIFIIRVPSGQVLTFCIDSKCKRSACLFGAVNPVGELVIPKSVVLDGRKYIVTSIGGGAFYQCILLKSVNIPKSVKYIEDFAFSGCTGLSSVVIPDSVTHIGDNAFECCTSLSGVTIPGSVTYVGDYSFFACDSLTSVVIPDSVIHIGNYAFYECESLDSVVIGNSVTEIKTSAFDGCRNLSSVIIPDSVESIGEYAFANCSGLTSVTIPDSVTEICCGAFAHCTGLNSIVIPDSVTSIGDGAFYDCSALANANIPNSVTKIVGWAFGNVKNVIYHGTATGNPWNALTVNGYEEGDLVYSDETKTHLTGCKSTATSVVIPDTVVDIGRSAFRNCDRLSSIVIPDSVISIGDKAFTDCIRLASVDIPDSVIFIGEWAFQRCKSLANAAIGSSIRHIGIFAFEHCDPLICKLTNLKKFYKGFEPGLVCMNYHFKEGVVNELDDKEKEISLCKHGFHFCDNPLSVFDYYSGIDGEDMELWEVEPLGKIIHGDNHKHCCEKLRPIKRIPFSEIRKIVEEGLKEE